MCIQGTDGCENPKPCRSQLTVLEYGDYDGDPVTKVVLQPLTGRTHQLRVHCEAVGHPIVGDHTYSLGEDSAPYRMMLHAHLLHLPLEPLPLQAAAPDPFTTPTDPRWRPQRCLRTVEGVVETLLEHRAAEERTEREEKRRQQEERRRQQEERRKRWRGREESEEQRRMCQQWLSEWTDV
uniref:RNA pseudouridine synthase domain containing 1 n=2 Tax=Oncorhynchus kisutch TaxID=8019 RepID=A0A8C7N4B9_ONCKI